MRKTPSLRETADKVPVLHYAVRLLSARPYSERKLSEKLRNRGYESAEIETAISKLKDKRLLDDRAFAGEFVRARCITNPRGKSALVRDLIGKGIPASLAADVVHESLSDSEEEALALTLIERKASQYQSLDVEVRKRRLAGFLARRGFRPRTIHRLLDQVLNTDIDKTGDIE